MLKFYNSTSKRDYDRFEGNEALRMPRHRLVPFQLRTEKISGEYIKKISLVDSGNSETDITEYFADSANLLTNWTNGGSPNDYDTFIDSSGDISSVIEAGDANAKWGLSDNLSGTIATGDRIGLYCDLTLSSGTAPDVYIGNSGNGALLSNMVALVDGYNNITFTMTQTAANMALFIINQAGESTNYVFDINPISGYLKHTNIPAVSAKTDYNYFIYSGKPLFTLLPKGIYSLKIETQYQTYYSDWICVCDIEGNLATSWTNVAPPSGYSTVSYTAATRVLTCTETSSDAGQVKSSTFAVVPGETIMVSGTLQLTSGERPKIGFYNNANNAVIGTTQDLADGDNEVSKEFDRNYTVYVKISNTTDTSWTFRPATVHREWGDYVRITWENTRDVRDTASKADLLFSQGLTQEIFLDTYLNTPIHESNEIGQEKDGTFIAEKMTATPRQRIVAYVPRSTYEGLIPLPLCDTITVWDEVGNKYLVGGAADQATGNLEVNFDFTYFEIGTLEILFSESSYYWTENIDNVT